MVKQQQKEIVIADFPHKYQEEIVIPHDLIPKRYWTWEYLHENKIQWVTLDGVKVRLKFLATNEDGYEGLEHLIERSYGYPAEVIISLYSKKYNVQDCWHCIKMEKI